jgi:hypothetical protein
VKHTRLMQFGLLFLVIANIARFYFGHHPSIGEDFADGITGFLYGLAIAMMLCSLWIHRRNCRTAG